MPARVPIILVTAVVTAGAAVAIVAAGHQPSTTDSIVARAAAHEVSVYPSPGSKYGSPKTQITLRGARASQLKHVTVSGSKSGRHSGVLKADSDGQGASFVPRSIFRDGETVTVHVGRPVAGVSGTSMHFKINKPVNLHETGQGAQNGRVGVESFKSRPDLQPSKVKVNTHTAGTSAGSLFVSPKAGPSQAGPMIVDHSGQLVWFQPMPRNLQAFDFRVQSYRGKKVLTWWQGEQIGGHGLNGEGIILDGNYHEVAHVKGGNGFGSDIHEFELTPRNTAWILSYNPIKANLSSVGGPSNGVVYDAVVQEIDIKTRLVLFEWHSLDHVGLTDSYQHYEQGQPYDYFHINAASDIGSDLLVSSRATSAVYRIDRATGHVDWRLNGKHSTFKMGSGTVFAYQHNSRAHRGDEISVFNNNAATQMPGVESAGLVIKLDLKRRKARLVRAFHHPNHILSPSQGNLQLLSNGHAIVGWGGNNQNYSEFTAGGTLVYDASFVTPGDNSYRAFLASWSGFASGVPAVAATTSAGKTNVYASWNGATKVAKWHVLAGATASNLVSVGTFSRTGFETTMPVAAPLPFVEVQALSSKGKVLGTSKPTPSTAG